MPNRFGAYMLKLRQTALEEHTEHTGRGALETLLEGFAKEAGNGSAV